MVAGAHSKSGHARREEARISGLELTGDSGWGEHASPGQGQGGSEKVPCCEPGQEAGGAGHVSPDPQRWPPRPQDRAGVGWGDVAGGGGEAGGALEVSSARLKHKREGNEFTQIRLWR